MRVQRVVIPALLFAIVMAVEASKPQTTPSFLGAVTHQELVAHSRCHDALRPLRGGAAPKPNKKNAVNEIKKRSPFGLPVLFGPTLYGHLDFLPQTVYFAYFSHICEGTAKKIYTGLGIFHTFHALATDYDGKGSWFQRLFGINIAVPMWTMYWMDIIIVAIVAILPSLIDGYTDESSKLLVRVAAIGGLLFFFPFADSISK